MKCSVLQYPIRPASMTYDDVTHLSAKIKPKQQKVGHHLSPVCKSFFMMCRMYLRKAHYAVELSNHAAACRTGSLCLKV